MERLIKLPEVLKLTGLSRSEIYRLEGTSPPKFPKRVPLSERSTAWVEAEVLEWVRTKIAAREQAALARAGVGRRLVEHRARAA
jgi:prophage regulatory protein